MARVSVEQKALSDARYNALARHAGLTNRYEAIGRCVPIWNECQERGSYTLTRDDILDIHPDIPTLYDALLAAGLARETAPGTAYICGTQGRIEWLTNKREKARENGAKGGRPPHKETNTGTNTGTNVGSAENQDRFPQETSPAPAPALPPTKEEHRGSAPTGAPAADDLSIDQKTTTTKKKKPAVDHDSDAYRLATLFLTLRRENTDPNLAANIEQWARDLAPEIRTRGADEVERMIRWSQTDDRERAWTESPTSLRKNASKIIGKMQAAAPNALVLPFRGRGSDATRGAVDKDDVHAMITALRDYDAGGEWTHADVPESAAAKVRAYVAHVRRHLDDGGDIGDVTPLATFNAAHYGPAEAPHLPRLTV